MTQSIVLIPEPKNIVIKNGFFTPPPFKRIEDICEFKTNKNLKADEYRIQITNKGPRIEMQSKPAKFYAIKTLEQIASQSDELPLATIRDWPDFETRGIYYDISRGRVPKLEELLKMIDILASYKINHFQLYIEHTFLFKKHPGISKGASPLSAGEIKQLDRYCADRHIELVPSFASFGHMSNILTKPKYRHLAEDLGKCKYSDPEAKNLPDTQRRKGWSISPANPDSYLFLEELFAEFLPLFQSKQFNVCCDETYDLGLGQSYELCKKIGKGKLYLNHIKKLRSISRKYGKRIMFWGDIIRKYPELVNSIPSDVTVLDWGYNHNSNFNAIRDFKNAGLKFMACPGTSAWVSLFPRIHEAVENISGFASAGKRNRANGLIITDWGDGGHYNFMEYSWHGYLFGAEQAWNTKSSKATFTERFVKQFLNCHQISVAKAIVKLGDITHLSVDPYYQSIWTHIFTAQRDAEIFNSKRRNAWVCNKGVISQKKISINSALANRTIKDLNKIKAVLHTAARNKTHDPNGILPYWIFAVDTLILSAEKLRLYSNSTNKNSKEAIRLRKNASSLAIRFKKLWLERNRMSEMATSIARFDSFLQR